MNRYLKYAIIFLLFLTIGSLVASLFAKSSHLATKTTSVNVSVDEAWKCIRDTSNAPDWMSNLTQIHTLKKADHVWNMEAHYSDAPESVLIVPQTWELEEGVHTLRITSEVEEKLSVVQSISIYTSDDSTRISMTNEVRANNWFNRLLLAGMSSENGIEAQTSNELNLLSACIQGCN